MRVFCCFSVAKSCLTLSDPMDWSTPSFPVLHYLLEFAQTHVHWIGDAIQQLCHPWSISFCPQSFPASGLFPMSQLFAAGGQSIGASASASILPMNIQGWFPLGLSGLILLSKGLLRVFSNTTVQIDWCSIHVLLFCCLIFCVITAGSGLCNNSKQS